MFYDYEPLPVRPAPELSGGSSAPEVLIVGAGPIGLAAAIDLALHGIRSTVLDAKTQVSVGSRAICWAKRTLEVFDRLGVGERMVAKGVTWQVGRIYHGEDEVYSFDLLPEEGHKMPAFINLQQYYVEEYLIDRCADFPDLIDLRWGAEVTGIRQDVTRATLTVDSPDGGYEISAPWALACDGARSPVRRMTGLEFPGVTFSDRFLIADIRMQADLPAERRFWFEPPFHSGKTALLHKQPDDIWRVDLQLGPDADVEAEMQPDAVRPRIAKAVQGREFELDWVSIYAFHCRKLDRFVHGRVIFAGDSAHIVSPFGARGGNGGIQDVDNLCWKLAMVIRGEAPAALLGSYDRERQAASVENIENSTRSTRFMMASSAEERGFRDAALALARSEDFARKVINSGRLSTAFDYRGLGLGTPGPDAPVGEGAVCPDAPLADGWLLNRLGGGFGLLAIGTPGPEAVAGIDVLHLPADGRLAHRHGPGVFLIRPDQHIAARWPDFDPARIAKALSRATAHPEMVTP